MNYALLIWLLVALSIVLMFREGVEDSQKNQKYWLAAMAAAWPVIILYALIAVLTLLITPQRSK